MSAATLHYRPASPAEAPLLAEFQVAMAAETENLPLDADTVSAGVQAVFADPGRGRYYVAEMQIDGGAGAITERIASEGDESFKESLANGKSAAAATQIAGSLLITYEWSDWRNGVVWWIQSVYVPPQFRRLGVYAGLYRYLQQLAAQTPEVRGIRLYVDQRNTKAQAVYERLGMNGDHYRVYEWMASDECRSMNDECRVGKRERLA
ncbi:MAG: GNAT family N-acetyltransferase [Pirellulales bacterium]|nr:GNAT family N-acetyltransferase [Pirellulales bacterium]